MDSAATLDVLALWLPQSLHMITHGTQVLVFCWFAWRNIAEAPLPPDEAVLERNSVGLAMMSFNLLILALTFGFNSALDAYTPVAFGEKSRAKLVAALRRQFLLMCGFAVPVCLLLANAENLLLLCGFHAQMAQRAAQIVGLLGLALPGYSAYDALSRWMFGQQLQRLVATYSLLGFGLNVIINLCFADAARPTFAPSIAMISQNTVLPFLLITAYRSKHPMTFRMPKNVDDMEVPLSQPTSAHTRDEDDGSVLGSLLWRQLCIALLAMLWTGAEQWAWQFQLFEASAFGADQIASYSVLPLMYSLLMCMFPGSIARASNALIGEALGQNDWIRVARVLKATCNLTLFVTFCYTVPLCLLSPWLAGILSGGVDDVRASYARALPLVLSIQVLDAPFQIFKQWLTVCKQQGLGAMMTVVIYYCIGLPLGFCLSSRLSWGLAGIWTGLGFAMLLGCTLLAWQISSDILQQLNSQCKEASDSDTEHAYYEIPQAGKYPHTLGGASIAGRGATPWPFIVQAFATRLQTNRIRKNLRLHAQLAPCALFFLGCLLWQARWRLPASPVFSAAALQGESFCIWSAGRDYYTYPFSAHWNMTQGTYGWEASMPHVLPNGPYGNIVRRLRQVGHTATSGRAVSLHLGGYSDTYGVPFSEVFDPNVEVGWGIYFALPDVRIGSNGAEWTSIARVGTRVSSAAHNFCGCQYLTGDATSFVLTEYGRAMIEMGTPADGPPWYFNSTRQEINHQIEEMCTPYSSIPCPDSNETAHALWAARTENSSYWAVGPWIEVYNRLPHWDDQAGTLDRGWGPALAPYSPHA